jgi:hypothetical protein
MCHVFNTHTTGLTVDEDRLSSFSVKSDGQVEFPINGKLFNNVDTVTREASISRLLGDQCLAAHFLCYGLYFSWSLDNMHSSFEVILLEVA